MPQKLLMSSSNGFEGHYTDQKVNRANGIIICTFSVLTIIMAIVPLLSFIKIRQVGPCSLIVISVLFSGFAVISTRVWDSEDHAQWYNGAGFCHLVTPLRQPLTVAFSFAMVLMPWKLIETLNSTEIVQPNRVFRDLLFVWGIPFCFILPFQFFVMENVYSIIPGFGCVPEYDDSWLSLVIVYIWWPLLLGLTFVLSIIMCVMIHRKREEISTSLKDKSSRVTQRTFIKLYVMAVVIIAIYLPVQLIFILQFVPVHYTRVKFAIENSDAWGIPSFYHTSDYPQIQYQPWAYIAINFLMFLFYGAGNDALRLYMKIWQMIGLGKIFPRLSESPPCRALNNFLSYVNLVGFVTQKFENRRKSELEKFLELSQQDYLQDADSATKTLNSLESMQFSDQETSRSRSPQFNHCGPHRTVYNIRFPLGLDTDLSHTNSTSQSHNDSASIFNPNNNIV